MGQECCPEWFFRRGFNLELPWFCKKRNSDSEMYPGSRHKENYCGTEPSFLYCQSRELITRKCSFPLMEWFGSLTPVHTLTLGILDTWVNPWWRSYTSSPWAWLVRDSSSRQMGKLCKDHEPGSSAATLVTLFGPLYSHLLWVMLLRSYLEVFMPS